MTEKQYTRELADFAAQTKFADLPRPALEKAKQIILDQFGVQIGCSVLPWSRTIYSYARRMNAAGKSTVVNYGLKTNPEYAAMANSTFGHGFELDDYHVKALVHTGCVITPAALALGEEVNAGGRDFITAVVLGCEIMVRFGLAMGVSMVIDRGFHPPSVFGPFGTAAAAGSLLKLDSQRMVNALGIAGSHSSGVLEYERSGGDIKRLHSGLGAVGGIRSALLAELGFTGPATVIEGERGMARAFSNKHDLTELTRGLGGVYHMADTAIKPYCCCAMINSQIEAVNQIMSEHNLKKQDIAEIIAGGPRLGLSHVGGIGPEPKDITGAQFSSHFSLGLTIIKGANDMKTYMEALESGFRDKDVLDISHRVKVVLDEDCEKAFPANFASKITIKTRDNRSLSQMVVQSKGTPENPLSKEELENKFMGLAGMVLPPKNAGEVKDIISRLEELDKLSKLTRRLVAAPGKEIGIKSQE